MFSWNRRYLRRFRFPGIFGSENVSEITILRLLRYPRQDRSVSSILKKFFPPSHPPEALHE